MRGWLTRFLWACWAVIVLLVLAMHFFGQRWWVVAGLVYVPPMTWIWFLTIVAITAWWLARRLCWICLATMAFLAGPLWEWRTHRPAFPSSVWQSPQTLRVLTANRGDHHGHSMADFVIKQKPDVIAIQDSIYRQAYVPGSPEYAGLINQSRVGEFLLLSRYPITKTQLLLTELPPSPERPRNLQFKAARFEIDWHGQPVAIYSAHLPSPRQYMRNAARQPSREHLARLKQHWTEHQALIVDLTERIETDNLPVIVLGDWNQPAIGPNYRQLTRKLQDSHTQAGLGYGASFPGDWWNPFTMGRVWMRLDLILCSREWRVLRNEVEPESETQHCAVSAVLHLR